MKRKLNEIDTSKEGAVEYYKLLLEDGKGKVMTTFSSGQWDFFLESIYKNGGFLVEVDMMERPIKIYHKTWGKKE